MSKYYSEDDWESKIHPVDTWDLLTFLDHLLWKIHAENESENTKQVLCQTLDILLLEEIMKDVSVTFDQFNANG
jgi:hypothetical protein